jgi:signal peptidase I
MKNLRSSIITTIIFLLIFAVFAVIFRPVSITGISMEPGYMNGERYLAKRLAYQFSLPQRLEVVILHYDNNPDFKIISRVIGLPGEKIMIKAGNVYINGTQLKENYVFAQNKTFIENKAVVIEKGSKNMSPSLSPIIEEGKETLIPEGSYFVMGDNREYSYDSRVLGFVKKENIESKVEIKY